MKKAEFDKLCQSVRDAGKIRRGEAKPSRRFVRRKPQEPKR